jgi:hypothetical protein
MIAAMNGLFLARMKYLISEIPVILKKLYCWLLRSAIAFGLKVRFGRASVIPASYTGDWQGRSVSVSEGYRCPWIVSMGAIAFQGTAHFVEQRYQMAVNPSQIAGLDKRSPASFEGRLSRIGIEIPDHL